MDNNMPNTAAGSVVRYRVGLNPIQQSVHDEVVNMSGEAVQAFVDAFRRDVTWSRLAPLFPKAGQPDSEDMVNHILGGKGHGYYFVPNDLVEHAGLHADTVDKYLHNYIGVWANSPDYKRERMTRAHEDAPWGECYAAHLTEPLPLRLISPRALVFIIMAPASIYRPTTGDEELVARWRRLVQFRTDAPTRFGVSKGAPKRIDDTVPTTTSVRRTPHTKKDTNAMLDLDPENEVAELFDPKPVVVVEALPVAPAPVAPAPVAPVAPAPVALDGYFAAITDLRARAERLRGLLDLLPAQEVESRVADFFRAGLNVLDKSHGA